MSSGLLLQVPDERVSECAVAGRKSKAEASYKRVRACMYDVFSNELKLVRTATETETLCCYPPPPPLLFSHSLLNITLREFASLCSCSYLQLPFPITPPP